MKFSKKVISHIGHAYCIMPLTVDGKRHFAVASDKEYGCELFDIFGNRKGEIWSGPGGTMSMAALPNCEGQFLASQCTYSPDNGMDARISLVRREGYNWTVRKLNALPCVHRFDFFRSNAGCFFLACTLKEKYLEVGDWRFPGRAHACKVDGRFLSGEVTEPLEMSVIMDGLMKNHGFTKNVKDGIETAIVSCEGGVYRFTPPTISNPIWRIEKLLDLACSDALLVDLDGCGQEELLCLSPFHGDVLSVYKLIGGEYHLVWEYWKPFEFAHAITSANIAGRQCAVVGCRKAARELLVVTFAEGRFRTICIDHDTGVMNAMYQRVDGKDVIVATNGEIDEIAYYEVLY